MLGRMRSEESGMVAAEVLARTSVPLNAITLVGVANDPVRQRVRDTLATTSYAPKVSVYPPWFQ